jgi:hypothetical protein
MAEVLERFELGSLDEFSNKGRMEEICPSLCSANIGSERATYPSKHVLDRAKRASRLDNCNQINSISGSIGLCYC